MSDPTKTLEELKKELEKERDRIKAILARRAHKDPNVQGNYITDFPDTGDDIPEIDDAVHQDVEYEIDLDIEHVLEKRLRQIEADLQKIAQGVYRAVSSNDQNPKP